MKLMKLALLTLVAGVAFSACTPPQKNAAKEDENAVTSVEAGKKVKSVKVTTLEYSSAAVSKKNTSTVVAYQETYLSPALSGKIRSIKVEVNDQVKKGQLLVEMDRTQLDQTRLQYAQLKTDLNRMDTLLRHGSITQQAYDQLKAQVETTELVLKNLEENTLLRAPYSGVITGKYYNDGELYSPSPNTPSGKAALVSIIQMDPVKVMVNLSEKAIPMINKGMKASVITDVYPGEEFEGTVFRIHPTVNAATRTFTVEIKIPNKNRKLTPGMFARVNLKLGEREALIVPAIAVLQQTGTNERYIMIHEDGKAKKMEVKIETRFDDRLEISSGDLKGGEELIIAGQSDLEDGAPVNVVVE